MKQGYCLSCYAPGGYLFSVPLRASTAWLKKVLCHQDLIDATPLRRAQFEVLSRRVPQPIEVGWHGDFTYYIEGYQIGTKPRRTVQRKGSGRVHSPSR